MKASKVFHLKTKREENGFFKMFSSAQPTVTGATKEDDTTIWKGNVGIA